MTRWVAGYDTASQSQAGLAMTRWVADSQMGVAMTRWVADSQARVGFARRGRANAGMTRWMVDAKGRAVYPVLSSYVVLLTLHSGWVLTCYLPFFILARVWVKRARW